MKKVKKLLAAVLWITMLASLLAACGSGNTQQATSKEGNTTEVASSTVQEKPDPAALLPYTGEAIVYKAFAADLSMKEDPKSPIFQEYQKFLGNVTIEWDLVPWADFDTKTNLYLTSGDVPDIMWTRNPLIQSNTFGDSGTLLDFEKYKENMPCLQEAAKIYSPLDLFLTEKGARYALPTLMATDYAAETWLYNKTLLDKLGVAVPTTTDELYTAMKTIKQKDPGVTPFLTQGMGMPGATYTLYCFKNMFNVNSDMVYDQTNKKWFYDPISNPDYKVFIEYISKCYDEKLLDPSVVTMSDDAAKAKVAEGNWAFTYNYADNFEGDSSVWPISQGKKPPIDVEPMLTPAYKGKSNFYLSGIRDGTPGWGYLSSAKVKNPEILASVLDLCYNQKAIDLYNWGIDGLNYNTVNGSKVYTDDVINGKFDSATQRFLLERYVTISPPLYSTEYQLVTSPIGKKSVQFVLKALQDGKMQANYTYPRPIISTEDNEKRGKIFTPIWTYGNECELKFLTGKMTVADWDEYLNGFKKLGNVDDALAIYNNGKNLELGERVFTKPEEAYGGAN